MNRYFESPCIVVNESRYPAADWGSGLEKYTSPGTITRGANADDSCCLVVIADTRQVPSGWTELTAEEYTTKFTECNGRAPTPQEM